MLLDSRFEEDIELDVSNENHGWLFGTPLCPLPCYDLVIEDSLQEFHASLQSLKPEERLISIKNRISSFKVNSDIPPIGYRNLLLLSVVEAIGAPKAVKDEGFFLAQQVEFFNWILRPSWEDKVSEKRQRKQHKTSVTNDKEILLDDGKGGLVHPSRSCAIYSRNQKITVRGASRLKRWMKNLPRKGKIDFLIIVPKMFLVIAVEEGIELVKVLMCIKLHGRKFSRVDDLKVGDKDALVIVQVLEELEGSPGEFRFSEDYVFRCTEQIICSINVKGCKITKDSVLLGEEQVNSILAKAKNSSVKGCMPVRPQISNLNENITLYRERLEENTVNELKYFCKENLLRRVGSKSELIARVQSNLSKRKLEVI